MPYLLFSIGLLGLVIFIMLVPGYLERRKRRKLLAFWDQFAWMFEFDLMDGKDGLPRFSGEYEGYPIVIQPEFMEEDEEIHTEIVLPLEVAKEQLLYVQEKGAALKTNRGVDAHLLLYVPDVLPKEYAIYARTASFAHYIFTEEIRAAVIRLMKKGQKGRVIIEDGKLHLRTRHLLNSMDDIAYYQESMDTLVLIVQELEA